MMNFDPGLAASLATLDPVLQANVLAYAKNLAMQQQQQRLPLQQQLQFQQPPQPQHTQPQLPQLQPQTQLERTCSRPIERSASVSSLSSTCSNSSQFQRPQLQQPPQPQLERTPSRVIERSSSDASQSSSCSSSFSTPPSSTKKRECPPPPKKARRRKRRKKLFGDDVTAEEVQLANDRKAVLRTVLTFFDAAFLAPQKALMFKRTFRKKKNPDSSRSLKKSDDMDEKMFKVLVRIPLRHLLGESFSDHYGIMARYTRAAMKVVKKRRANHVQGWRPCNGGMNRLLRYGGRLGEMPPCEMTAAERAVVRKYLRAQSQLLAATTPARKSAQCGFPDKTPAPAMAPAVLAESTQADFPDETPAPTMTPVVVAESTQADFPDETPESAQTEFPEENKCVGCGKPLTQEQTYPKEDGDWSNSLPPRCSECWDKKVQQEMMPLMGERDAIQHESQFQTDTDGDLSSEKAVKPCKKCGSITHKNSRHMSCPYNKRNLVTPPPATDKENIGKNQTEKKNKRKRRKRRKTCRCGSTTHRSTLHSECPLNKKKRTTKTPVSGTKDSVATINTANVQIAADAAASALTAAQEMRRNLHFYKMEDDARAEITKRAKYFQRRFERAQHVAACAELRKGDAPLITSSSESNDEHEPETTATANTPPPAPAAANTPPPAPATANTPPPAPAAANAPPPAPAAANTPTAGPVTPPPQFPRFAVGQPVLAKWSRRKWFLAHVYDITDSKYCCYFMDNQKKILPPEHVRPDTTGALDRQSYLDQCFFQDGFEATKDFPALLPGCWKIVGIKQKQNNFVCTRMEFGNEAAPLSQPQTEEFDIGYVIRCMRDSDERMREQGPVKIMAGKLRTV